MLCRNDHFLYAAGCSNLLVGGIRGMSGACVRTQDRYHCG
jgi:hypothetical protein